MELAADGVVGGVGVGPFGVGGELEPEAAGGGLFDEGVAVDAGAGGAADGTGLVGLSAFVGGEGVLEFGAFGLVDFGEFVGGGCPGFLCWAAGWRFIRDGRSLITPPWGLLRGLAVGMRRMEKDLPDFRHASDHMAEGKEEMWISNRRAPSDSMLSSSWKNPTAG